jgi:dTDP-4-dehydrorhamnose 3,5-epimerase-like enzyme
VGEFDKHLPFVPKRYFVVFDVPSKDVRGEHAHKTLHEFLVCVHGSLSIVLDDGNKRREVQLNSPTVGLHIPPLVWGIQYRFSSDAVLLVLASEPYDPDDYIRDYDEFLKVAPARRA